MSVLSVVDSVSEADTSDADDMDTNGQHSESDDSVDIAQRLSRGIEDFLTGLTLESRQIHVNWEALAPIFSTISGIVTALTLFGGVV